MKTEPSCDGKKSWRLKYSIQEEVNVWVSVS